MHSPSSPTPDAPARPVGRVVTTTAIAVTAFVAAALTVALPLITADAGVQMRLGESASEDILAPAPATYVSQVLTERARAEAATAVPDQYDAPDARVARQQVLLLRDILDFVSAVRADTYATTPQKRADLLAIEGVDPSPVEANLILAFDVGGWTTVREEALAVLEQMMRSQVRADQIDTVRQSIPARVSVSLTEAQATVVTALVTDLIAPNAFYNEGVTIAAREAASAAVQPVTREIVRGQAVVVRGQVITEDHLEALQALGLQETTRTWREPVSAVLAVMLAFVVVVLYVARFRPDVGQAPRKVLLIGLLFVAFLAAARFMVPGRTVLPFLFPVPALALLVTVFIGAPVAIIVSVTLAVLVGYMAGTSLEITTYAAVGGIIATLAVGRGERLNQFFWAGLAVAIANFVVLLTFRLPDPNLDTLGLSQLLAAGAVNGAISASLTLAGFFTLGAVFDITTSLQLIELSRPDHPLLRFILRNAPGTYQHSLQVANLAEQAAERIGANAMLTRVGALYHDAGKALHPQFFIENQLDGFNIHQSLDPVDSARIIVGHIRDGIAMARRHRLPSSVRAFIPEHHGTLRTIYQYKRAVQAAGGDASRVDASAFVYPGPRPRSKETALLMLADGCEARARSARPQSDTDIDRIVRAVIDDRVADGQLDDTSLTLRDLGLIRESFVNTLKGMFHPRLEYPGDERRPALSAPATDAAPAAPAALPAAAPVTGSNGQLSPPPAETPHPEDERGVDAPAEDEV